MLVLSRKPDEAFHFPRIGATVRVLSVSGSRVKIGIDAPRQLEVRRGEPLITTGADSELNRHELGNRLNAARLALYLAERHYAREERAAAEAKLRDALHLLTRLEQQASGAQGPVHQPQQRVLIVEDNDNECRLLAGVLQLEGFDVVTAADGQEAVERLESDRPDFVLLDLRMPRMNGEKTIHAIRGDERFRSLKVFLMSTTSPEEAGLAVGHGGIDGWLPKPLDPAAMLAELRSCSRVAA